MLLKFNPVVWKHAEFSYQLLQERYAEIDHIVNIHGLSMGTLPTLLNHRAWLIDNAAHDHYIWEEGGEFLAIVFIRQLEDVAISIESEVGVFVSREHWGRGVGERALRALFDKYPGCPLHAKINPLNERSKRLFRKLGFNHIAEVWSRDAETKSI